MDLKDYIKILKKNFLSLLILTALSVAIGMIYSQTTQPGYKLEQVFIISSQENQNPSQQIPQTNAKLELTSPQQEARDFTDTAVALLQSKSLNQGQPDTNISAEKLAPQLIKITAFAPSSQEAKVQIERTLINFNRDLKDLITGQTLEIKTVGQTPIASLNIIDRKIILAVSFFIGLTFSVLVISLKNYFKL